MEHFVNAFCDKTNVIGALVVMILGDLVGHWQVFALFLCLNVIDFFYGWLKGRKTHTLSSGKGANGIMKKVTYWVVIGVAFGVAEILVEFGQDAGIQLDFLRLFGWFTLGVYILNEITSIVENLVVLGYDVPEIFVRGLNAARKAVDAAGDKVIPKEENDATNQK